MGEPIIGVLLEESGVGSGRLLRTIRGLQGEAQEEVDIPVAGAGLGEALQEGERRGYVPVDLEVPGDLLLPLEYRRVTVREAHRRLPFTQEWVAVPAPPVGEGARGVHRYGKEGDAGDLRA